MQTWSQPLAKFPTACGGDRQEGGPARGSVWQRHGLMCGGMQQTCENQFLIPLVVFLHRTTMFSPPVVCPCAVAAGSGAKHQARLRWLL